MKASFAETLAKFRAVADARAANEKAGHGSVPATPLVPGGH